MSWPRQRTTVVVLLLVSMGLATYYFWPQPMDQKALRLLHELANQPKGKFEFVNFSRSTEQIDADFDLLGTEAVPGLIEALQDPDISMRYLAAGRLGKLRDRRAVEPLLATLNDQEACVRVWAIKALGDIGDKRAVDALIPLVRSEDPSIRCQAAQALGTLGDKRAYESLLPLVNDKEIYPRHHAVAALGQIGDQRAVDVLLGVLSSDHDPWVKSAAIWSLGRLGDPRAIPTIKKAVGPEWKTNDDAKEALDRLQHNKRTVFRLLACHPLCSSPWRRIIEGAGRWLPW